MVTCFILRVVWTSQFIIVVYVGCWLGPLAPDLQEVDWWSLGILAYELVVGDSLGG